MLFKKKKKSYIKTLFFSRFVRTHGKSGPERDSRDTTLAFHLAGLNTDRYKSDFALA